MNLDGASGLYVLNLCVDKVILINATNEKRKSVCLQAFFWGLPLINIYQARTSNAYEDGADPDVFVNFETGSTGYFHSATIELIRSIQRHPIVITVFQNLEGANCFESVGTCRVKVTEKFSELISRAATCAIKHAVSGVIKGIYNVLNKEHIQVGTISLSVRLVCYDNSLLRTPYVPPDQSNAVDSGGHSKYLLPKKTSDGFVLVPAEAPDDRFTEPFLQDLRCSDEFQRNSTRPPIPINGATAAWPSIDISGLVCDTTISERFFNADQSNDSFVNQRRGGRKDEANESYTVEHPSGKTPRDEPTRKMTIETYFSDSGTDTKRRVGENGKATDSATRLQENSANRMPVQIYHKDGFVDGSRNSSPPASPVQETSQQSAGSVYRGAEEPKKQPDYVKEDQPHDSTKKSANELILSAFAPRLKQHVDCDPLNYEYSTASQRICEKYQRRNPENANSSRLFEKQTSRRQVSESSYKQAETTASPIPSQHSSHEPVVKGANLSANSSSTQPKHSNALEPKTSPDNAADTQQQGLSEPSQRQQPFVRQNSVQVDSSEKLISKWSQTERTVTKCTQSDLCLDGGRRFQPYTAAWNPPGGQKAPDTPRKSNLEDAPERGGQNPKQTPSNQSTSHPRISFAGESQEERPSRGKSDIPMQERFQSKESFVSQSPIAEATRPLSHSPVNVLDGSAGNLFPEKATSNTSIQIQEICKFCFRNHSPPPCHPPEKTSPKASPLLPISRGKDTARTGIHAPPSSQLEGVNHISKPREPESSVMGLRSSHQSTAPLDLGLKSGENTGEDSSPYVQQDSPANGIVRDSIVHSCHQCSSPGSDCGLCIGTTPESRKKPEAQSNMNGYKNDEGSAQGNEELQHHIDWSKENSQQALPFTDSANKKKNSRSFFQNESYKEGPPNRIQTAVENVLLLCGCQGHIQRTPEASDEVDHEHGPFFSKTGVTSQAVYSLPADYSLGKEAHQIREDFQSYQNDSRWKSHGKPRSRFSRGGQADTRHSHARRTARQVTDQEEYAHLCDNQSGKAEAYLNDYLNIENTPVKSNFLSAQSPNKQQWVETEPLTVEEGIYPEEAVWKSNTNLTLQSTGNIRTFDRFAVPHGRYSHLNSPFSNDDEKQSESDTAARYTNEQELYARIRCHLRDLHEERSYSERNPNVCISSVDSPGTLGHSHLVRWREMQCPGPHTDKADLDKRGSHRNCPSTEPKHLARPSSAPSCSESSVFMNRENPRVGGYYLHYAPRSYRHDFRDLNLSGYGVYGAQTFANACAADSCARSRCMWRNCHTC